MLACPKSPPRSLAYRSLNFAERLLPAMTIKPPEHFVPAATGIQVTVFVAVQVPICLPSGEQMDWPG